MSDPRDDAPGVPSTDDPDRQAARHRCRPGPPGIVPRPEGMTEALLGWIVSTKERSTAGPPAPRSRRRRRPRRPVGLDAIPAPDPAIRAEIDRLRQWAVELHLQSPHDPLPLPELVTLGVLRYYLSVLECPRPDPQRAPYAASYYDAILYLVSDIPDIDELSRWCKSLPDDGGHLTVGATLTLRALLSQSAQRSYSDVDGLRIADVMSHLGRSEPDRERYDPWVFDGPPAGPSPPVGPDGRTEAAAEQQAPPPTIDYDHLATELRKQGKKTPAALVEYMADKSKAPGEDIATHVHGDAETSDSAMWNNAKRTSDALAVLGSPLWFRFASGWMFRETSPE